MENTNISVGLDIGTTKIVALVGKKNEFNKVERSYIPINAIIRIDEVVESGEATIKENKDSVTPFPLNIQPANKSE